MKLKECTPVFTIYIATIFLFACQNKQSPTLMADTVPGKASPFDFDFQGDLQNSLAGNGNVTGTVGSGPSGGLTDADRQALTEMTKGLEQVNTTNSGLSQELIDEAKRILEAEANAEANAQQNAFLLEAKMKLVGKILEQCAKKIAPLAPIPGQPLMGVWKGGGACPVEFEVSATGPQPLYRVSGGTEGRMTASADGRGDVQATPFSGSLNDSPSAGTGKLVHPTFHKTKTGADPCEVAVSLQKTTNPIPENYIEAMKELGKCHRQALLFMSPVMDKMFQNMPSNLSSILLKRGLGVSK